MQWRRHFLQTSFFLGHLTFQNSFVLRTSLLSQITPVTIHEFDTVGERNMTFLEV